MTTKKIKRTPCEVYSRVVGYLRPVQQWNDGKQAEYNDRVVFKTNEIHESQQNKDGKPSKRGEEK